MLVSDVKRVVEQVSRDRGIDREILIKTLEEALRSAARKKFGTEVDVEAHYNEELGEIEVFQFKEVVEDVTQPDIEISLEEGAKLDPDCEVGDSLGTKMDTTTFGRIAAQSAKQVIIQKMKDAERDVVYDSFIDRKGQIINGIVQRIDRGDIVVNLGRSEAVLPTNEQVPSETYRRGDRIRAYIVDVLRETRGPQIIVSRTHPQFLVALFKTEVPEITEGIVTIMAAAREPGGRAKISVASNDSDIDPVGACVGMKGNRVQSVVQELKGEKIDIIPWHSDPARFVCNALAPAEVSRVVIDENTRVMEVIVPDEYLSVAIGKRGQNVRLASKLSGWGIDIKSESQYSHAMRTGYESLLQLPEVGAGVADALYEHGLYSIEEVANSTVEELVQIKGIGEIKAQALLEAAREGLEKQEESTDIEKDEDEQISPVDGVEDSLEEGSDETEVTDETGAPSEDSDEQISPVDGVEDSLEEGSDETEVTDETGAPSEDPDEQISPVDGVEDSLEEGSDEATD